MELVEAKKLFVKHMGFSLKISRLGFSSGKAIALMGESGSGKSTLLRCIAGLQKGMGGEVRIGGELMPLPEQRLVMGNPEVQYVSQLLDLMPFWSARDHWVESLRGKPVKEKQKVGALTKDLGLKHLDKALGAYSGGQLQRVALGKALLANPKVLLLDEVFNQVDHQLRKQMMQVLNQWKSEREVAMVFSTHDPEEVFLLADEVLVLKEGKMIQRGTLEEVYSLPKSEYVAGLLGPYGFVPVHWNVQGTKLDQGVLVRPGILCQDEKGVPCKVIGLDRYPDRYLVHIDVEGLSACLWMNHAPQKGDTLGIGLK